MGAYDFIIKLTIKQNTNKPEYKIIFLSIQQNSLTNRKINWKQCPLPVSSFRFTIVWIF